MVLLRRLFLLLIATAMVAGIVYAFLPQPIPVDVAKVTRGPMQVVVEEDGKTRIKERYVVSAPLAGQLLRIAMDPGDELVADESLLAVIEPNDPELLDARELAAAEARLRAAEAKHLRATPILEQAQVAMEFAESELARLRRLRERNAAPQQKLENAETVFRSRAAEFRSARFGGEIALFELEQAKAALMRTRPQKNNHEQRPQFDVRSPINGRVLRVLQQSAAVVAAGTPLLEVGDPTDLELEIDVLSTDAVKVAPGDKVMIRHWGGEGDLMGIVRLVEPSAFTKISALGVEEQRVNVIVDILDPVERRATLGDGFRVEANIVTWEQEGVLRVPTSALFREEGEWSVFLLAGGNSNVRRLKLGKNNGLEAQVIDGLEEHDLVVVHPSDQVQDGVAVRIR